MFKDFKRVYDKAKKGKSTVHTYYGKIFTVRIGKISYPEAIERFSDTIPDDTLCYLPKGKTHAVGIFNVEQLVGFAFYYQKINPYDFINR